MVSGLKAFLFLLLLSLGAKAQDENYENWLHKLHSQYYNKVPDKLWDALIDKVDEESYTVQKGDSLWDLSKTFFGDGFYWSKLWSVNKTISNPHIINLGDKIHFIFAGDGPPSIHVGDKGGKMTLTSSDIQTVSPIPPSFPDLDLLRVPENDEIIFTVRPEDLYHKRNLILTHFLLEAHLWKSHGRVFQVDEERTKAFLADRVLIKTGRSLKKGDTFSVARKGESRKGFFGTYIVTDLLGRIEIIRKVSPRTYAAKVVDHYGFIGKGDYLVKWKPETLHLPDEINEETFTNLRIFGRREGGKEGFVMPHSFVYLNKGSSAGVKKGQILPVYKNTAKGLLSSQYFIAPVGYLQVVNVQTSVATAILLDAAQGIEVGDWVAKKF